MRRIYQSYVDFCLVPPADIEFVLDQPYLFSCLVWRAHAECFAEALYGYLKQALAVSK